MTQEEMERLLRETHDSVLEIKHGLWGKPGTDDKGMSGELNLLCLREDKLSRNFWILIGILVGSGIIGGGLSLFNH